MREATISRCAVLLWSLGAICHASVITTVDEARFAGRELFHYYDIDTSMSFPCPSSKKSLKGKGLPPPPPKSKKGSKLPKGCKSPKETLPPKLPKSSKSFPDPGKGKGIAPPTKAPAPTKPTTKAPSANMPVSPAPAMSPSAVAPTAPSNGTDVTASPFTIAYTITTVDIPTTTDYDGLATMTDAYLQQIFLAASTTDTVFLNSSTTITNQSFMLNQPVVIQWSSTLMFGPGTVPPVQDIDALISASFTQNSAAYQAQLAALTNNLFSTTTSFNFTSSAPPPVQSQENPPQASTMSAAQTAGIASAAGAGAFLLLIGGIMLHRKRHGDEDEEYEDNAVRKDDGHMTVAGDTFAGSMSMDSGARQSTDEDAGPIERSEWEAYAKYSTAEYRNTSPNSSGNESDGSDDSGGRIDLSPRTRRTLDDVDI